MSNTMDVVGFCLLIMILIYHKKGYGWFRILSNHLNILLKMKLS